MSTTVANVQSWLKTQFGPPIEILPEENTLASDIGFIPAEKQTGDKYRRPVRLQNEHGFTYNSDHSAFALLTAKDAVAEHAELEGAEIAGVANISYGIAAKMARSKGGDARAYKQGVGELIEGLMLGGEIRREIALWYGPGSTGLANLGVVNAVVSAVATTLVVNVTRATWAAGMWNMLIGAGFDFHTAAGVSHAANAEFVLAGVNPTNCRLTFTGNAADVASVLAADVITFRASRTVSCVGMQPILENTGALFGIDASVYPQWKALQYAVGGPLTFDKVVEGCAAASENGLSDGGNLYVGARAWTDLMTDEASLRRHVGDKSSKSAKTGYGELEFESLCGAIKIKTHRYLKQGIAAFIPTQYCERVGAQDLSFSVPGNKNQWFWRELDGFAGSQIRLYGDQAVLNTQPNKSVLFTGISSTSDAIPA